MPRPHAAQHSDGWQRPHSGGRFHPVQRVKKAKTVRAHLDGVGVPLGTRIRQAHVLDPAVIALVPLGRGKGAQPIRRRHRDRVQRRAQRFGQQLQSVQVAHRSQHLRAVGPLPSTGFQQSTLTGRVQQAGKQALGGPMLEQPGTKLAQDREVEAGISQIESQQVFPVNPASNSLGRSAIAQPLAELHERNKGQPPRRRGGLAKLGVEVGKVSIGKHAAEPIAQEHIRVAAPERGLGDAGGVVGHRRQRLQAERHGRPPDGKPLNAAAGPNAADFTNSIRSDCVQVVIALIVTPDGLPLAYEVMPGNTADKTTLRDFLQRIEAQYGKAGRTWVMDRGVPTEAVLAEMRAAETPTYYLVGTPRGRLSQLEKDFLAKPWTEVREAVQVKLVEQDGELYILARSGARRGKEQAMRRGRLKKLVKRLHELRQQKLTRDQLLIKLGAARKEAGLAAWW